MGSDNTATANKTAIITGASRTLGRNSAINLLMAASTLSLAITRIGKKHAPSSVKSKR